MADFLHDIGRDFGNEPPKADASGYLADVAAKRRPSLLLVFLATADDAVTAVDDLETRIPLSLAGHLARECLSGSEDWRFAHVDDRRRQRPVSGVWAAIGQSSCRTGFLGGLLAVATERGVSCKGTLPPCEVAAGWLVAEFRASRKTKCSGRGFAIWRCNPIRSKPCIPTRSSR